MRKKPKVSYEPWDPDDKTLQPPKSQLVSVGELKGKKLPDPEEVDLSDTGVKLPDVEQGEFPPAGKIKMPKRAR